MADVKAPRFWVLLVDGSPHIFHSPSKSIMPSPFESASVNSLLITYKWASNCWIWSTFKNIFKHFMLWLVAIFKPFVIVTTHSKHIPLVSSLRPNPALWRLSSFHRGWWSRHHPEIKSLLQVSRKILCAVPHGYIFIIYILLFILFSCIV
jgi:hypothetical protein